MPTWAHCFHFRMQLLLQSKHTLTRTWITKWLPALDDHTTENSLHTPTPKQSKKQQARELQQQPNMYLWYGVAFRFVFHCVGNPDCNRLIPNDPKVYWKRVGLDVLGWSILLSLLLGWSRDVKNWTAKMVTRTLNVPTFLNTWVVKLEKLFGKDQHWNTSWSLRR